MTMLFTRRMLRLSLMFIPLFGAFAFMGLVIQDLKHPDVRSEQCRFVGRGQAVQQLKASAKVLYRAGSRPEDDIILNCARAGAVYLNDAVPLPIAEDRTVNLHSHYYRYLPVRYTLDLPTINPEEATQSNAAS